MDRVQLRNTPSLLVTSLALSLSFVVHCAVIYSLAGVELSPRVVQSRFSVSILPSQLQSQLQSQIANNAGQNDRSQVASAAIPRASVNQLESDLNTVGAPATNALPQQPLMLEQSAMATILEPAITNPVVTANNDLVVPSSEPNDVDVQAADTRAESTSVTSQSPKFQLGSLNNPEPSYPPMAIKRGWQGDVVLGVEVGLDGHSQEVVVLASSGYSILDSAALETIRDRWIFTPARSVDLPIIGYARVPVSFRLD